MHRTATIIAAACFLIGLPISHALPQSEPTAEKQLEHILPDQGFMAREWLRHRTFPYEEKARTLIAAGQQKDALQELEKGLALIPDAHMMRWRAIVLAADLQRPMDVLRLSEPLKDIVPDFALLRLFRATAMQSLGQSETASAELTLAMELHQPFRNSQKPSDLINQHILSLCAAWLEQKKPQESRRCLEELRQRTGDTPDLLRMMAEAQRREGDIAGRTATLEALARIAPDSSTLISLADARWAGGDTRGSAQALEEASYLNEETAAKTAIEALLRWKSGREWSSADRVARRILEHFGPDTEAVRQALTALAETGTATRQGRQRRAALEDLYARGLISVDQRLDLAFALLEDGKTKNAVRLMWETLQHEQSPRVHVLLATALDRANRKGPAADFYERALQNKTGQGHLSTGTRNLVNASLGYLYYDTGQPALAARHWEEALSGQQDPVLRLRLAQAQLGDSQSGKALEQIKTVNETDLPDELRAVRLETWARALAATGQDDDASRVYQDLNAREPSSGRRLEQSLVERRQGNSQASFEILKAARDTDPDNETLGLAYAYAARDLDDHSLAEPLLSAITAANPDQLSAREDLGYTRAAIGDTEGAQKAFSDTIKDERLYAAMRQYTPVQNRAHIWGLRRQNSILNDNLTLQGYTSICPQASACRRTTSPVGDALNEAQGGVELAWRPPAVGYRDGRTLAITGRLFWGTINGSSLVPDKHTTQAGAGLRWKPMRDHDINLAVERLFAIGSRTEHNTLIRLSYGLSSDMDIPPDEDHLTTYYSFYVDAGRFMEKSRARLVSSELRLGGKWRMGTACIVAPFALVGGSHTGTSTLDDTIARSGIGLHGRLWYNESAYYAPQSYIDITPRLTRDITKDGQGRRQTRFVLSVLARF